MGRPKKIISSETKVDIIDKLVKEIDPEVLLAGMLGAVAVYGGVTPPFTRMLLAMSENGVVGGDMVGSMGAQAAHTWFDVAKWGSPLLFVLGVGGDGSSTDLAAEATVRGKMASGALEAMVMLSFAKNPAAMEAMGNAIKGITSIKLPI